VRIICIALEQITVRFFAYFVKYADPPIFKIIQYVFTGDRVWCMDAIVQMKRATPLIFPDIEI